MILKKAKFVPMLFTMHQEVTLVITLVGQIINCNVRQAL